MRRGLASHARPPASARRQTYIRPHIGELEARLVRAASLYWGGKQQRGSSLGQLELDLWWVIEHYLIAGAKIARASSHTEGTHAYYHAFERRPSRGAVHGRLYNCGRSIDCPGACMHACMHHAACMHMHVPLLLGTRPRPASISIGRPPSSTN